MASAKVYAPPRLPLPIFRHSKAIERYLLYDAGAIAWLRQTHNILGVLLGTLPQVPQQNVFLGLPLELMPEEARLLVEMGIAYATDDLACHQIGLTSITQDQRDRFVENLAADSLSATKSANSKKTKRMAEALKRLPLNANHEMLSQDGQGTADAEDEERFFSRSSGQDSSAPTLEVEKALPTSTAWATTPITSYPPLPAPLRMSGGPLPTIRSSSYALFKHLHSHGYVLSPGLRFGCQFLVYPGDPLRFHSHFLAMSADWDEEIDLLDLVGGGRLGTGVKKGWMIGGVQQKDTKKGLKSTNASMRDRSESGHCTSEQKPTDGATVSDVRTFCIEWGGM